MSSKIISAIRNVMEIITDDLKIINKEKGLSWCNGEYSDSHYGNEDLRKQGKIRGKLMVKLQEMEDECIEEGLEDVYETEGE